MLQYAISYWEVADWENLYSLPIKIDSSETQIIALKAIALYQLGQLDLGRQWAKKALDNGFDKHVFGKVLLSSLYHTVGKAFLVLNKQEKSTSNFKLACELTVSQEKIGTLLEFRTIKEMIRLNMLNRSINLLEDLIISKNSEKTPSYISSQQFEQNAHKAILDIREELRNLKYNTSINHKNSIDKDNRDISNVVLTCLTADDFLLEVDKYLLGSTLSHSDKFNLCLHLALEMKSRNDLMMAQHFANTALEFLSEIPKKEYDQKIEIISLLLSLGRELEAIGLALSLINYRKKLDDEQEKKLLSSAKNIILKKQESKVHGHDLLLKYLEQNFSQIKQENKKYVLIEIGTTRENVSGQGSTGIFAKLCHTHDIDFITVDMDEHNTRTANDYFSKHKLRAKALTSKGEDFLANYEQEIDFIFLDAYDFDHGGHSELRQSRYQKFLGSRIDEIACHEMHLICARHLLTKLAPDGLICLDDTWQDDQKNWVAKGTLATPFLLQNGFSIIEQRNRAVLLKRNA